MARPSSIERKAGIPRADIRSFLRPEGRCPKGATGLSPGFQPWDRLPRRRALKGRQIEYTNNAEVGFDCGTSQLRTLIFRNDWMPNFIWDPVAPSERTIILRFPGLKPWAEFWWGLRYG